MRSKPLAVFFAVAIWLAVFGIIAYSAITRITEGTNKINIQFKTVDDLLNGNS